MRLVRTSIAVVGLAALASSCSTVGGTSAATRTVSATATTASAADTSTAAAATTSTSSSISSISSISSTSSSPAQATVVSAPTGTIAAGRTAAPAPARHLVWAALGDSYSAGIGGSTPTTNSNGCEQDSAAAYAPKAKAAVLTQRHGLAIEQRFVACSGATTSDLTSQQLSAANGADIVTMTIGGNDMGFVQAATTCVLHGCSPLDLPDAHLPGFASIPGLSDWDALRDRLVSTYVAVRKQMSADGHLLVITYPIALPEALGASCPSGPVPFHPDDIVLANALSLKLGDVILDAVSRANSQLAALSLQGNIGAVDWRLQSGQPPARIIRVAAGANHTTAFNPDGICTAHPMINGISITGEFSDTLHPTDFGYDAAANLVAADIVALYT